MYIAIQFSDESILRKTLPINNARHDNNIYEIQFCTSSTLEYRQALSKYTLVIYSV